MSLREVQLEIKLAGRHVRSNDGLTSKPLPQTIFGLWTATDYSDDAGHASRMAVPDGDTA